MSPLMPIQSNEFQVLTSNTLVFTNENILLKYYYACKNVSKNKFFESLNLSFPLRIVNVKAKDKHGELLVVPKKDIKPGQVIQIKFRKPVYPQEKYSFKLSILFDFGSEIVRWHDTYFLDWGKENIDEIVFLKTTPLFVSGLGEWKQNATSSILTPLKGWKRIASHARKDKSLRFEWGKEPTFRIKEIFQFSSSTSPTSVSTKFILPRSNEEQQTRWFGPNKSQATIIHDASKNTQVIMPMYKKSDGTWEYVTTYEVTQKPRIHRIADLGEINPVIKAGLKYPELIKETPILTVNDPDIQTLAELIRKSATTVNELLTLLFEFIHQKIKYVENGERFPASQTLRERQGDCSEFSDLFITVLRAIGIPAFGVLGYVIDVKTRTIGYHEWVKVLTKQGWVPFDPTWGYFGGVGVTHIEVAHEIHEHNTWYSGYHVSGQAGQPRFTSKVILE